MKYLYALAFAYIGFVIWTQPVRFDERWIFDNAVKVSQGQLPYRDFAITYGPAPYLAYGLVFKVFGYSWLTTRICATLIMALFFGFMGFMFYVILSPKVAKWLYLVLILFFWEYPLMYISLYVFIVPLVILLAFLTADVVEFDDSSSRIALLTAVVFLFRPDTGLQVTLLTTLLLFLYGNATRFEQYLKYVGLAGVLTTVVVLTYASPGDIINTLAQTWGITQNYGSFNLDIHKWTHVIYKFPIFSPILICTLSAMTLFKKPDTERAILTAFTLLLYVPVLYSLDTPHAVPSNLTAILLAGMMLREGK